MTYRTRTYLAGDWTGDKDAIDKLHEWNASDRYALDFVDAHELKQANDGSLNCTIKNSLRDRMNASKTFVLVVGDNTDSVKSGACSYCDSYSSGFFSYRCSRGHSIDNRSYIEYECDLAVKAGIKIVVLYNSYRVNKSKCPISVRNIGMHVAMRNYNGWDYASVKNAIMS